MGSPASRRTALLATAFAVLLLVVAAVGELIPRLLRSEPAIVGTPVPSGLRAPVPVPLEPGQEACINDVPVTPDSERVRLGLRLGGAWPSPPLRVSIAGDGYRETATVRQPERWDPLLETDVDPPARTVAASVCVRNVGDVATELDATADPRVLQRTRARVDGAEMPAAFMLTFTEAQPSNALQGLPETIERAATFSWLGPWAFWVLLALAGVGVPVLVLTAFHGALRDADPPDPPAEG